MHSSRIQNPIADTLALRYEHLLSTSATKCEAYVRCMPGP